MLQRRDHLVNYYLPLKTGGRTDKQKCGHTHVGIATYKPDNLTSCNSAYGAGLISNRGGLKPIMVKATS